MVADRQALDVVCFGGAVVDRTYQSDGDLLPGTSNPVRVKTSFGGVARNVAENLAHCGAHVGLISRVGMDDGGRSLHAYLIDLGIEVSPGTQCADVATAQYVAVLDKGGDLHLGLAAMDAFDGLNLQALEDALPMMARARWVFADCNPPAETLAALLAAKQGFKLAIDTVSLAKAARLPDDLSAVDVLFTNADEARVLVGNATPNDQAKRLLARGVGALVLTLGAQGHVLAGEGGVHFVPASRANVVDVTGAGDAMVAGTLNALLAGHPLLEASRHGAALAKRTVEAPSAVVPAKT